MQQLQLFFIFHCHLQLFIFCIFQDSAMLINPYGKDQSNAAEHVAAKDIAGPMGEQIKP
jgi:hypothetical protein